VLFGLRGNHFERRGTRRALLEALDIAPQSDAGGEISADFAGDV